MTIGEFIVACMKIDNEEDAKKFFDDEVLRIQKLIDEGVSKSQSSAVETARSNIGFCFGEGMSEERIAMWVKVCGASHPWFGTTLPSSEHAFLMGMMAG